jgi:hypothetical protein
MVAMARGGAHVGQPLERGRKGHGRAHAERGGGGPEAERAARRSAAARADCEYDVALSRVRRCVHKDQRGRYDAIVR